MYDVIVIGQGLAGSLLSVSLIERGLSVLVIDNGLKTSATKVAAGMMNPVTGKRLVKLWDRPEDEAAVVAYYRNLEFVLGVTFLHCFKQYRFLNRPEELKALPKRLKDAHYLNYINPVDLDVVAQLDKICDTGMAQFCIENVYQLNTVRFLAAVKSYLENHNVYRHGEIGYADINLTKTGVNWQGIDAKRMVFCEGARGEKNPFFKDLLEFENAYGHILNVAIPNLKERFILNHGKWLCPDLRSGISHFRYGTTTYWEDNVGDAENALIALKSDLDKFLYIDYSVSDVQNAVRPVMRDRQPKALWHPEYSQLGTINGLGGQGISCGPRVVEQLLVSLLNFCC